MANDELTAKHASDAPDGPATPGPSSSESAGKASSPEVTPTDVTPKGDPAHPGVTTREGFYFFRDEYQLPKEPSVEQAETRYLAEVEKAFENRWPLHPNLIANRSNAQRVKHAYDLDFRDNEIRRIRAILPVDKPVFDYIDALVDVVMLKNLDIYVAKRFTAFKHIVRKTRTWFIAMFLMVATGVFASLFLHGTAGLLSGEIALVAAFAIATVVTIAVNVTQTWPYLRDTELKQPKEKYEEAVRDAAGLAASKLAAKGRDVENLMNSLKNKLDTMTSPDASRVEHAPKLVQVLLWNPERMGLIENYYRAKMDQFMVNSARVSIDGAVKTKRIVYGNMIFLSMLAVFFVLGLAFALLAASKHIFPDSGAATNLHAMWITLAVLALFAIAVTAVARSTMLLEDVSHTFEPEDVARHNKKLQRSGIRAALSAIVLGLLPCALIVVFHKQWAAMIVLSLMVLLTIGVWYLIPIIFVRRIFETLHNEFSSNVLEAVQRKMDASLWTRYSDLRIDQRLAEVFTAIYTAWHRADSKGVFT